MNTHYVPGRVYKKSLAIVKQYIHVTSDMKGLNTCFPDIFFKKNKLTFVKLVEVILNWRKDKLIFGRFNFILPSITKQIVVVYHLKTKSKANHLWSMLSLN